MRKLFSILAIASMMVLATAGIALAAHNDTVTGTTYWDAAAKNHKATPGVGCEDCHGGGGHGGWAGPHGGYTATTTKCSTCHSIHQNSNARAQNPDTLNVNSTLLVGSTVTGVCNFCHDLTGAVRAPYYTNYLTTDTAVVSAHRIEGQTAGAGLQYQIGGGAIGTNTAGSVYNGTGTFDITAKKLWDKQTADGIAFTQIPGGDPSTGGTLAFESQFYKPAGATGKLSGTGFTCDSCHTPHAIEGSTVKAYFGESDRKIKYNALVNGVKDETADAYAGKTGLIFVAGNRLLKAKLTVDGSTYTDYGSAWCAGCHKGRLSMAGSNYNHPVNKTGLGYNFGMVALDGTFGSSGAIATTSDLPAGDLATRINAINNGTINTIATLNGTEDEGIAKANFLAIGPDGASMTDSRSVINPVKSYLTRSPRMNTWYTMTDSDPLNGNAARPDGYISIDKFKNADVNLNGPSCQQCHASPRDVEAAFTTTYIGQGSVFSNNAVTTFPHVSTKKNLLVENDDDLCTNCHGLDNLP